MSEVPGSRPEPGLPGAPGQPAAPRQPAQPVQPVGPPQPAAPAAPTQPVQPVGPAQPAAPAAPSQPVQPAQPSAPAQPPAPAAPSQPVQPAQPSAPAQPTDQSRPEIAPEPGLPGAHRGGFSRLPTAPVDVTVETAPDEYDSAYAAPAVWGAITPEPPRRGLAASALTASIIGLIVSLFVGWGFPIGIVGVVTAIVALRRPFESRGVAVWAIVLGVLSILYSVGWLLYAASRANLFS